jgi:tetratricopeptide (TPR) repeat protein
VVTSDPFAEVTRIWWERFASLDDWESAARIARVSTERRPQLSRGWEDWAWALHKQGKTRAAYKLLAPLLKKLVLPGPPSGRAAYSLACFCGALKKNKEATRWLQLAYNLSVHRDELRTQALLEPDLREIWPGVPELSFDACNVLE